MNNRLYGLTGTPSTPGARHKDLSSTIEKEGGRVARKHWQDWKQGRLCLYFVIVDGALWYFVPNPTHGYAWQKIRPACVCAKNICQCS